jgi:O-antigen/teichoic acid export membrane protein
LGRININLILYIEAISTAVYVVPSFFYLTRFLASLQHVDTGETKTPVTRKRIIKYGMYSSFNELGAGLVGKTSDFFIVSAMSNMHLVGLYSFANKVSELMYRLLPHNEFMTIIRPLFIQKFTKDYTEEGFNKHYNFMVKVMIPVFVIPVLYFIVFGKSVITYVFDPKYLDTYFLCVLILSVNIFYAIFFPVSMVIRLRERMDISFKSKIVVVFSIVGGIYAMKFYGVHGLALVTVLGDLLKNLYMYYQIRKEVNISYNFNEMKNYLFIFILVGGIMFMVQGLKMNFLILVVETIIFIALLGVLMIRYHIFNAYDMQYLDKIASSNKYLKKIKTLILAIYSFGR